VRLPRLAAIQYDGFAILDDDSIACNSAYISDVLVKIGDKEDSGDSRDRSGVCMSHLLVPLPLRRKGAMATATNPDPR
jgi:hypothetical protein